MKTSTADLDSAFAALADSTRRAVIRELRRQPLRAGELAQRVQMSPPALSRHLRVLREAGLVIQDGVEHDARVSLYRVAFDAFAPLRHWLDEVDAHWQERLASFKEYAEALHSSARRGEQVPDRLRSALPARVVHRPGRGSRALPGGDSPRPEHTSSGPSGAPRDARCDVYPQCRPVVG